MTTGTGRSEADGASDGTLGPVLPDMHCVGRLGTGGFADVYVYERYHPRVKVAVKVLRDASMDAAARRQFTTEAELMAELSEHPFIVPVLGAGETTDGRPYLVMKFYPFADLAVRTRRDPMAVTDALRFAVQLLSALETAHRAGIVHRDIKPSNILLTAYGAPGLGDFGTAGRVTTSGEDIGVSLPWAAPEVLSGADDGTAVSDVYGLAATMWTLLVGHPPFERPGGDNSPAATSARILADPAPPTGRPDVVVSLDRLLLRAMAKDPQQRPCTALDFAEQLRDVERELGRAPTDIVLLDRAPETMSSAGAAAPSPTVRRGTTRVPAQAPADTAPPPQRRSSGPWDAAEAGDDGATDRWRWMVLVIAAVATVVALAAAGDRVRLGTGDDGPKPVTSDPVEVDVPGVVTAPSAPMAVAARVTGDRVEFTWSPVVGADGYRWTSSDGRAGRVARPRLLLPYAGSRLCVDVRAVVDDTGSQGATRGCAGT